LHEDKGRAIENLNTGSNEEILHIKKIVFTGGLSCGKTTTIKMLEELGYSIADESSEAMINNFKHNFGHYPWEDKEKLFQFHQEAFLKQLEIEKNAKTKITFFDRGLPDRLAFMIFDGLQPTEEMMQMAKRNNYDKVIFFEGNNKCYELASHRPHNISDSVRAAQIIKKVYQDLGYDLLILPFCSKEERLQIILNEAS
jgi:predicted ATPase